MEQPVLTPKQEAVVDALFADLPKDFPNRLSYALQIRDAVRSAMATSLQDSLNEHLAKQPQHTHAERSELATSLNASLRNLSLTIRCPKTNLPAILIVDTMDGTHPDVSRYRLQVIDEQGKRRRTLTSYDLPLPFELMPAPERRESLSKNFDPPRGPFR